MCEFLIQIALNYWLESLRRNPTQSHRAFRCLVSTKVCWLLNKLSSKTWHCKHQVSKCLCRRADSSAVCQIDSCPSLSWEGSCIPLGRVPSLRTACFWIYGCAMLWGDVNAGSLATGSSSLLLCKCWFWN